jgi:hypothetical protein
MLGRMGEVELYFFFCCWVFLEGPMLYEVTLMGKKIVKWGENVL